MPYLESAGTRIHYLEQGSGAPVVLIHGLASHARHNWGETGWIEYLSRDYRVLAPDCRGHGLSDKFDVPEAYSLDQLTADVVALLDHLQLERAGVLGYSMGGWVALGLAVHHPDRLRAVAAGGVGLRMIRPDDPKRVQAVVRSLTGGDGAPGDMGRSLREMCARTGNNIDAIAAVLQRPRHGVDEAGLRSLKIPALLAVGTEDPLSRGIEELRDMTPGARLLKLEGRHHMNAITAPGFKETVAEFFRATAG